MALPVVPLCNKVVLTITATSVQASNVFHVINTSPDNPALQADIVAVFQTWWLDSLAPLLSTDVGLLQIQLTDISVVGGTQTTIDYIPADNPGGIADPTMSFNSAMTITHRTGHIGKSYRGRSYQAGFPENTADAGAWNSVVLGNAQAAYDNLVSGLAANDSPLVIVSYFADKVLRDPPIKTQVLTNRANERVYSQRRRTRPVSG